MAAERLPEEVFTPRTIVSREMFTRRNEPDLYGNPGLQDTLAEAIREPGTQILVFGDTGVGKSSLVQYASEDENAGRVTVECRSGATFDDQVEQGLRKLVDFTEVEVVNATTTVAGGEAGVSKIITLKGSLKREDGSTSRFEAIRQTPIEALLQAMHENGQRLLVFDNFQNVENEQRIRFGEAMEMLSDRAAETGNVKMLIVGIADDARTLLATSGSIRRRTSEIGVPRMPDDEIQAIFLNGFRLLGLTCDRNALHDLTYYSDGFPYFAHLLGLNVARLARRRGETKVGRGSVDGALERAGKEVEQSFEVRVRSAFEAGGKVRPRRRILELMAYSPKREMTASEIIGQYASRFGEPTDTGFLHAALGQLIQDKYGAVLQRTGTRGRYIYKFRDPQIRPYARIVHFPLQLELF
jgi:hypothetical protein